MPVVPNHFEALLGFTYGIDLLEGADEDKDGVLDRLDRCPEDPEDRDGFEDLDGCPETDNDNDGVRDDVDKCRDEPPPHHGFSVFAAAAGASTAPPPSTAWWMLSGSGLGRSNLPISGMMMMKCAK